MLFTLLGITLGQTIGTEQCDDKDVLYAQTQGCCLYQFNAEYTREVLAKKGTQLYNDITKCNPRPEDNYFLKGKTQYLPCGVKGSNLFNGNQNIVKVCRPLNILKADLEELAKLKAKLVEQQLFPLAGLRGFSTRPCPTTYNPDLEIKYVDDYLDECKTAWKAFNDKKDEMIKKAKKKPNRR